MLCLTLTLLCHLLTFPILIGQRLLDEVRRLFEVDADVEVVCVAGRYAVVDDPRAGVELGVGVDMHEGVSLGGVEDVGDTLPLQTHHVHRHKPAAQSVSKQSYRAEGKPLRWVLLLELRSN